MNRLFVLSFRNEPDRIGRTGQHHRNVEIIEYLQMILKHMKLLELKLLVKEVITRLVVY